jgi:quinol monooxygenase YgiN
MSEQVSWLLELEIQAGREDDLRTLMTEMVDATRANEPGTLDYEWCISSDGKQLHLFERYVDSAATLVHLGTFGNKFAARFMEILKPVGFVVYGAPSDQVRNALAAFGPEYMERIGGFSR